MHLGYNNKNDLEESEVQTMSVTIKDVEHVAGLARLALSEEEKERFTEQLNAILKYAEQLNQLDTDGVEPTSHAMPLVNVLREDERRESLPIEKVLLNAPDEEDGQIKVPAVLE
ncbi:GatC [Paenibacillus mucilaginosus KNP414]|nr:GatC [Paenibacillus mucilaginosus KNP414]